MRVDILGMNRYVDFFCIWVIICETCCISAGVSSSSATRPTWRDVNFVVHENKSCKSLTKYIKCYENVTFVLNRRTERGSESHEHVLEINFVAFNRHFTLVLFSEKSLSLRKRSIFHRNMAVTLVGPSGPRLVNYNVDRYFSGYLRNDPSSIFHGKYHDGILDGVIYTNEESYYLEPMQKYFKKTNRRSRSQLVAYREKDVIWLALNATATRIQADGSNISDRKPRVGEAVYMSDIHAQKYAHVPHQRRRRRGQLDKLYRVCELSVVVDHSFYRAPCGGSLAKTIDKISFAIRAADAYFRRVDFNFDTVADNIGFMIKDVLIYTKKNAPGYRLSESLDPNVVLDNFAHYNFSGSCLGVLFTHREFYKGVIGLAYTGSSTTLGPPGGLCYPRMQHSSGWKWLNSLLLTSRNYLLRIPWSTVALTLTHELGHSFGARHDTSAECLPGGKYGMYLMHASATDFTKPNSYTFSPCSIRQMGPVVQNKGFCLKTYDTDEYCGNYLLDVGEECDCGADQRQCNVFDRCCVPPSTNEPGCRIRHEAGHVCSPLSSPCCTGLCRVETEARVCLAATDCTRAAVCDSVSVECPEPVPLADGTLCAGGVRVCSGGQCVGSRCKLYGWIDCECAGVQDELCQLCCAARNTSGSDCKPAYRLSDTDTLVAPIYKNEADTCNQQSGFCTKTHACITAYPKDVDNVYDAIFQKSAKERMHDMLANYWFYGLLLLVLLVMCFELIRFAYHRDETASTIAYRSAKFTSLWLVMRSQTLTLAEQLRRTELIYNDLISNLKYEKPVDFVAAVARLSLFFPSASRDELIFAMLRSNCEEFAVRRLLYLGFPMKKQAFTKRMIV